MLFNIKHEQSKEWNREKSKRGGGGEREGRRLEVGEIERKSPKGEE